MIKDVRYCMWRGYTFAGLAKRLGVTDDELRDLIRQAWK